MLQKVRSDVRKIIEPYLPKLLEIHKENIASIVLYGSATGKYFIPKRSDINLAVIFKDLEFKQLKDSLKLINSYMATHTPEHLDRILTAFRKVGKRLRVI
jgi:predicted nucleotidyltransferase